MKHASTPCGVHDRKAGVAVEPLGVLLRVLGREHLRDRSAAAVEERTRLRPGFTSPGPGIHGWRSPCTMYRMRPSTSRTSTPRSANSGLR